MRHGSPVAADSVAAFTSPIRPYIPFYTRSYHQSASRAFNLVRFAVETFQKDMTVLATAMVYWHEFAARHGCRKVNEGLLASVCVFLALKVEHHRVRVDQIVKSLLDVDPSEKPEEFKEWRDTLLQLELLLSDTLHFDFQRTHCLSELIAWIEGYENKPATARTSEEGVLVNELKRVANTIFIFSFTTPIYTKATPQEVALTILSMVTLYAGCEGAYTHIWVLHPLPDPATCDGILGILMDAFAFLKKDTGLVRLDEQIRQRRKRLRSAPVGSPSARSTAALSSSVGSGSHEASPFGRGGEL